MCSFKVGLLAAGLAIWISLVDLSMSAPRVAVAAEVPTPQSALSTISTARKQIVLRLPDGTPVSGVSVKLTPADPLLGGPQAGAEAKSATTGADGSVTFTDLGQWVWMTSFSGTFQGKALQPMGEQGKVPYGRTRSGGGFPVVVQRQEEDAPATPVMANGTPRPEVQPSLFVLLPGSNVWVPTLDLSLLGETPQPLALEPAAQPAPSTTPHSTVPTAALAANGSPTTEVPSEVSTTESLAHWFYILPVAVALFAVYKAWQERRHRKLEQLADRDAVPQEEYE